MSKSSYLLRCLAAQFAAARYRCPNCGGTASRIVDRKFVITQLRHCGTCQLLFRTPTDRPESNRAYYEARRSAGAGRSGGPCARDAWMGTKMLGIGRADCRCAELGAKRAGG
jgi:hypothetical protein